MLLSTPGMALKEQPPSDITESDHAVVAENADLEIAMLRQPLWLELDFLDQNFP